MLGPRLAEHIPVASPDLRSYGDNFKPPTTADRAPYAKRAIDRAQIIAMRQLGFEHCVVTRHDRNGRCAYLLALDYPAHMRKLAVLDIIPTGAAFWQADMAFGRGSWHRFFLAQPAPLPERLIPGDPAAFSLR